MIQQGPCPSCGRVLTLRMGGGVHFCLNCRFRWSVHDVLSAAESASIRTDLVDFSPRERHRLEVYRRAVAAGFFRDWP